MLLHDIFHGLLAELQPIRPRYLYGQFNTKSRLTGLIGPRGVGKTTLLLQYIKQNPQDLGNTIYCSMDHIYFNEVSLYNFVTQQYQENAITRFFLDEIHKYPNWNQELKNIYDSFPKITVVFSGSSSLDITKGAYDLSRRAKIYYLQGMSFREYLNFTQQTDFSSIDLENLLHTPGCYAEVTQIPGLLGLFKTYLRYGFYPFLFEDELSYYQRINQVVDKTIYEDIASFYKLKTNNLSTLKNIINHISALSPNEINLSKIATYLNYDKKTIGHYINILHEVGLLRIIKTNKQGNAALRSREKYMLNNTTLMHAVNTLTAKQTQIGTLRELFFCQSFLNETVFYSQIGDYAVADNVFEIDGKNKTKQQIKNSQQTAYLVKDDILNGTNKTIPLYAFGFLY